MNGLHAWIVDDADTRGAENTISAALAATGAGVDDGVVMMWPRSRRRPHMRSVENVARTAVLGEPFWGLWFGALFHAAPSSSPAQEATFPAALTSAGLGGEFCAQLRRRLAPGAAAIVLFCPDPIAYQLTAALPTERFIHLTIALSDRQLSALRDGFTP